MPTACPGNPGAWSAPLKPARLFINHPAVARVLGTGPAPLVEVPFGAERWAVATGVRWEPAPMGAVSGEEHSTSH